MTGFERANAEVAEDTEESKETRHTSRGLKPGVWVFWMHGLKPVPISEAKAKAKAETKAKTKAKRRQKRTRRLRRTRRCAEGIRGLEKGVWIEE